MGPEGYLPFFGDEERVQDDAPESEAEKNERETENPYVKPNGDLGASMYQKALSDMRTLRALKPLLSDERIITDAIGKNELRGHEWELALAWAIKNGEVPAKKEIAPTIKVIKGQKSLKRYGGNPNADRMLPENDR